MKKNFNIEGMHCVSCESVLGNKIKEIKGVDNCEVSYKKKTLDVEGAQVIFQKIREVVEKSGYKISDEKFDESRYKKRISLGDIFQIIAIFIIIIFSTFFLAQFDITRFFPSIDKNVSFAVAFFLGTIASVSTCLALTGGIIMSFSGKYKIQKENSFRHRALPQIYFHFGRIGGFALLGGLLGLLGSTLKYSVSFTGYLTIFVALVMFYIGFQILNIVPNITKFGFHLPKKMSVKINDLQKKEHPLIPGIVGALTFFLPCGFTQLMQLVAVASGSFLTGAMVMTFFALGTFPVLFLVGIGSSYAQNRKFGLLKKVVGVVIVFFALYSFNSGLVLAGANFTINFWSQKKIGESFVEAKEISEKFEKENEQIIKLDINYNLVQKEFHIKKDIPVRFEINAIHTTGCTDEIIIPRLGLSSGKLKPGINILEFTPTEKGTLPFSCWMGMQGGKFIVE